MINDKLIEGLKRKNEEAFNAIYHETKRGVYSIIFSVTKSHQTTEDLMQDVYMKMMQSIDSYQMHTNFNNWLLTMAKNLAIDYYRREKKVNKIEMNDMDQMNPSKEILPDEEAKFQMMIHALDEEQRTIILLRMVDDLKFKDISTILNKPIGTILWQYQQALKVIKRLEGLE